MTRTEKPRSEWTKGATTRQQAYLCDLLGMTARDLKDHLGIPPHGRIERYVTRDEMSELIQQAIDGQE